MSSAIEGAGDSGGQGERLTAAGVGRTAHSEAMEGIRKGVDHRNRSRARQVGARKKNAPARPGSSSRAAADPARTWERFVLVCVNWTQRECDMDQPTFGE